MAPAIPGKAATAGLQQLDEKRPSLAEQIAVLKEKNDVEIERLD